MLPIAGPRDRPPVRGRRAAVRLRPRSTIDASTLTAATLGAFLLGLTAHALIAVLARAFYAQQDTRTPVIAAHRRGRRQRDPGGRPRGPLGLPGLGLAIAIAAWIEAAILLVILRGRVHELELGPVWAVAARSLIATVIASVAAVALNGGARRSSWARSRASSPWSVQIAVVSAGRARGVRARRPRLAHHGAALYRRDHGRPAPPTAPSVSDRPTSLHADDTATWDAFVAGRPSGLLPPALGVGPGQGRQRLVGGPAARRRRLGRPHRRPGPRPPAATAALGVRLRPARPRRRGLVAGRRRGRRGGLRRGVPVDAPGAGGSRLAPPDRPRDRGGRSGRRGRRPAPGAACRRLAPGAADPAERDPDHRPRAPTRTRSGATSARSGGST